MTFKPRWYQLEARECVYRGLSEPDPDPQLVVLPTGSGKTPLTAMFCLDALRASHQPRVMIVSHVKELLQQTYGKLLDLDSRFERLAGVYSAGLDRRDTDTQIVIGGIQSVYKRPKAFGKVNLLIIDEVHLLPEEDEGMYRKLIKGLLKSNPDLKIVGLTASPYRLKTGYIYGEDKLFKKIAFEAEIQTLIDQGYLTKIRSVGASLKVDATQFHLTRGDFDEKEMSEFFSLRVPATCSEILAQSEQRQSCLHFVSSVAHGEMLENEMRNRGIESVACVFGKTDKEERADFLARFKARDLKHLISMNVLTTGFDAPVVDMISLVRATMSPGLYQQMIGRGLRVFDDKEDCIVLDFGGNIKRHGPLDALLIKDGKKATKEGEAPVKECPNCKTFVPLGVRHCAWCFFEFPAPERKIEVAPSDDPLLKKQKKLVELEVEEVRYKHHMSKAGLPTVICEYTTNGLGEQKQIKEYVCFEHSGYPRRKASDWWSNRTDEIPCPRSVDEALRHLTSFEYPFKIPEKIYVCRNDKGYLSVKGERFREEEEDD